jgi:hypothetical protein
MTDPIDDADVITVPRQMWTALQICLMQFLVINTKKDIDVVQVSMPRKAFRAWGKFMLDNNVHLEFKADDENVYIGVIQVEEEENEQEKGNGK